MADFFLDVKKIRDTITRIQEKIGEVNHRHEALLVAYSQEQTEKANQALETTMSAISQLSNNVRVMLKKMEQQ